jgi:hypothetical protein
MKADSYGWICIFSPQTWAQAGKINYSQAALPALRQKASLRMRVGQPIFPYITGLKCIAGLLEIVEAPKLAPELSYYGAAGQYPLVIRTRPLRIIAEDSMLQMEDMVGRLRLFRGLSNKKNWIHAIRLSPRELSNSDTEIIRETIIKLPHTIDNINI